MSENPEIRRAARFLIAKYGVDAEIAAARCVEAFAAAGEREGSSFVRQVLAAIVELRRRAQDADLRDAEGAPMPHAARMCH